MVSRSFKTDEMVLVRQDDGLLWPATITQINTPGTIATITFVRPLVVGEGHKTCHPTRADVEPRLIYKFSSNASRLLKEAKQATFDSVSARNAYINVLQYAINEFDETATEASSSEEAQPSIAIIPVLRTKSPPPSALKGEVYLT